MHSLSDAQIRASFINVSQRERAAIELPGTLAALDWDRLDFLGWRGSKAVLAGHVVGIVDGEPVGVLLRRTESRTRARPQCAWCEDVTLPNDVVFFGARRAGAAGRRGDSVGTLVCEHFECSRNVRTPPPPAYLGYDIDAAIERRISALRMNIDSFLRDIRDNT